MHAADNVVEFRAVVSRPASAPPGSGGASGAGAGAEAGAEAGASMDVSGGGAGGLRAELVTVTAESDPELFFGLRGAGGRDRVGKRERGWWVAS